MKYDVDRIKRARILKGWSQSQLAQLIGKSSAAISMIENGEFNGMPGTIKAIADALAIPMEELLIDEADPCTK